LVTPPPPPPENPFSAIVTRNAAMQAVFRYIGSIAATSLPVLVSGETGTGKEQIANAIHAVSGRSGEFVPVNVAGVDDHLFCDTLFGHEKGAFTGADRPRAGLIEKAAGGTLFLDEIGELSMESQVRLLRLLQERQYYPLGSDTPKTSDSRIVAATNRDLLDMADNGTFRRDLFYRLQYHQIALPPLRKRREDIEPLVRRFVSDAALAFGKKEPAINHELFSLLNTYDFPGNIRELQAMVFDAVGRHECGSLSSAAFAEKILQRNTHCQPAAATHETEPAQRIVFPEKLPTIKETTEQLIAEAIARSKGNQTVAAQLLGITRRALNNRLHRA